jgi:hypothetical protein
MENAAAKLITHLQRQNTFTLRQIALRAISI